MLRVPRISSWPRVVGLWLSGFTSEFKPREGSADSLEKEMKRKAFPSKGRLYLIVLFVALSYTIFGILMLHKLKEIHAFNLILSQKQSELTSLHLLLQKDREVNREMKAKADEMKAKLYMVRNQKTQLNGKFLELQNALSFLEDKHRAAEIDIQESGNTIRLLKEKETELRTKTKQLNNLTEAVTKLKSACEKEARTMRLQVRNLTETVGRIKSKVDEKNRELMEKEIELNLLRSQVRNLTVSVGLEAAEIKNLRNQLAKSIHGDGSGKKKSLVKVPKSSAAGHLRRKNDSSGPEGGIISLEQARMEAVNAQKLSDSARLNLKNQATK